MHYVPLCLLLEFCYQDQWQKSHLEVVSYLRRVNVIKMSLFSHHLNKHVVGKYAIALIYLQKVMKTC